MPKRKARAEESQEPDLRLQQSLSQDATEIRPEENPNAALAPQQEKAAESHPEDSAEKGTENALPVNDSSPEGASEPAPDENSSVRRTYREYRFTP